ncbi:MAG: LysR family transcriptional regulator [Bacteroidota bacterium]
MNFQQLQYIVAVEEFKNFSRAALACDVAQSTLSREIQRLEQEYDIIIFDRTRNPVVPTLKGLDLLKKSREILLKKKEFVQIAEQKNNEVSGSIALAITEILAPYLTPLFIYKVSKKYPNLELKLLELSDRRIEDLLITEEIDAAVMISPSLKHDYYEFQLYEEEMMLYSTKKIKTSKKHEINTSSIDFSEMFIHQDLKDILQRQLQEVFGRYGKGQENKIKYLKGNLETIRNIIDYNGGAMLLPKVASTYLSSEEAERIYTFIAPKPKLNVSLVSARGFEKNRIIKRLIKELKKITSS